MSRLRAETSLLAAAFVVISCSPASALFNQWKFAEFFSNADGTVQFVELRCGNFNNQDGATAAHIHSSSTNKVFFFPANLPTTSTADKSLFVATDNFESHPGAVAPDFAAFSGLPSNFFNPAGDTVRLYVNGVAGAVDFRTFPSVPTDGVTSRHYPENTLSANSPTNFAGQAGSIDLSLFPGDYNYDGSVDAADYVVWRKPLTTDSGYTTWQNNFGRSLGSGGVGSPANAQTPEPSTVTLMAFAIPLAAIRRFHRANRP